MGRARVRCWMTFSPINDRVWHEADAPGALGVGQGSGALPIFRVEGLFFGAFQILAPRGLVCILIERLRRDVVVLAVNGAALAREIAFSQIGSGIAVQIHFSVVDPAGD